MDRVFLWLIPGVLVGGAWAMLAERGMDWRFGRVHNRAARLSLFPPPPDRARWYHASVPMLARGIYHVLSNLGHPQLAPGRVVASDEDYSPP